MPGAGLVSGLEVSVFLGTPLQHSLEAGPKVELEAWPKLEPEAGPGRGRIGVVDGVPRGLMQVPVDMIALQILSYAFS